MAAALLVGGAAGNVAHASAVDMSTQYFGGATEVTTLPAPEVDVVLVTPMFARGNAPPLPLGGLHGDFALVDFDGAGVDGFAATLAPLAYAMPDDADGLGLAFDTAIDEVVDVAPSGPTMALKAREMATGSFRRIETLHDSPVLLDRQPSRPRRDVDIGVDAASLHDAAATSLGNYPTPAPMTILLTAVAGVVLLITARRPHRRRFP
jgi:hypothetical protein